MRVALVMRDEEYRNAMMGIIADLDKDIFIEVAGPAGIRKDAVILTDIVPEEIEKRSLEKIRSRTLFLTNTPREAQIHASRDDISDAAPHVMFKYSSTDEILSALTLIYSMWSGNTGSITPSTRLIAVTGESDELSSSRCRTLAGQIMYRHGGSILILPLGYINDYIDQSGADSEGWFRRLMYMIDEGRNFAHDSFTYTDRYGVSYLRLPTGINPLTGLTEDYLSRLISRFCRYFDTVILDIGTCLSRTNMSILDSADNILFFGSGRRIGDIPAVFGEKLQNKLRVIGIRDGRTEELSMDDYVSELYGRDDKTHDNNEVQERDR